MAPRGAPLVAVDPRSRSVVLRRRSGRLSADSSPVAVDRPASALAAARSGVADLLHATFLPAGYPTSVSADYVAFQGRTAPATAVARYRRGFATNQRFAQRGTPYKPCAATCAAFSPRRPSWRASASARVRVSRIGLPRPRWRPHPRAAPESATPLAAAVQWVVRDGAGMLGGLAFSTWGGSRFDADARRWRLFADVINDVGLLLDMLSPLAPSCFLATVCAASVCKVRAARPCTQCYPDTAPWHRRSVGSLRAPPAQRSPPTLPSRTTSQVGV